LIGFLAGARNIVPQTNAGVECEGEDVAAIWGESDRGYGGVVFVDDGSEALSCCRVPDSTVKPGLAFENVLGIEKIRT
jgi:hypothetical protein